MIDKPVLSFFRREKPTPKKGKLVLLDPKHYPSRHLKNTPEVIVYLPPGYQESKQRYPVLYAHDGQNLFDPKTSYCGEWKLDKNIETLMGRRLLKGIIVVGVYNNGVDRVDEYTPTRIKSRWTKGEEEGGKLDEHGKFLVEELKPYIDGEFRTIASRKHTGIMGSSLGGLASFYLLGRYPEVFSKAGIISPSFWWDNLRVLSDMEKMNFPRDVKIYIDGGWQERDDEAHMVFNMRSVYHKLREYGLDDFRNIFYHEDPRGIHNEADWARRGKMPVLYLYGKFRPKIKAFVYALKKVPRRKHAFYIIPQLVLPNGMEFTPLAGDLSVENPKSASIDKRGKVTRRRKTSVNISLRYGRKKGRFYIA